MKIYYFLLLLLMVPLVSASVTINSVSPSGSSVYYGESVNLSVSATDNESRPLTYAFYLRPSLYFTDTGSWNFDSCNSASQSGSGLTDLNICECSVLTSCTGYGNRSINVTSDFLTYHWYIDNNLGDGTTTATIYINDTALGSFSLVGTSQIAENRTLNISRYKGTVQELKMEVSGSRSGLVVTGTLRWWFDQWGIGSNNADVQSVLVQNTTSDSYVFSSVDRTYYVSPFQYEVIVCNNETDCSSSEGHNISFSELTNCLNYTLKAANFLIKDEETSNSLTGDLEATLTATDSVADNTDTGTYSFKGTSDTNHSFCVYPFNARPSLTNFLTYESSSQDHITSRAYYFENTVLNPLSSQSFNLFLLNDTDLSSVVITIRDSGGVGLPSRLFKLERYNPSTNTYTNVDMCQTDITGSCSVSAHLNNVFYRYQVKNGDTILLTSGTNKISSTSLIITISTSTNDSTTDYSKLKDIVYTLKFYNNTDQFDLTFSDTTNAATQACLSVDELILNEYVSFQETCVTSNSGSIIINLTPTNGSVYRATALFTIQGTQYTGDILFQSYDSGEQVLGSISALLMIFVIIILAFIGMYNPSVSAILMAVGFILGYATGLLNIGLTPVIIVSALAVVVVVINKS